MFLSIFTGNAQSVPVKIYTDSVLNRFDNKPVGINLDYLMDDDLYLKPKRALVDALKAMGVKYLRYPGGNKSDFYFFSKPPYDKSAPTLARTGEHATGGRGAMLKDNFTAYRYDVLDFDEFMTICREVGAEPVIVVAADEYLVPYPAGSTWSTREQLLQHATEWVKYANIKKGHKIKYWMIGNESWHKENEHSTAEIYARDVIDFSKVMKAIDPSIMIIPNGNNETWWKTVLPVVAPYVDAICVSNYPFTNCGVTNVNVLEPVETAARSIRQFIPADQERLKIIVAEYGPFNWCPGGERSMFNTMGNNLLNMEIALRQLQHPQILFSCFWNTRWIDDGGGKWAGFDALDKNGWFNANGYGLAAIANFMGDQMVKTSTSAEGLKVFASIDSKQHKLYLYLLNPTNKPIVVQEQIEGSKLRSVKQAWELAATSAEDTKPTWREVTGSSLKKPQTINAYNARIIEYTIR
jgi:hypothetical protein